MTSRVGEAQTEHRKNGENGKRLHIRPESVRFNELDDGLLRGRGAPHFGER